MTTDDCTEWEHVDNEEERTKYGTLRNTLVDRCSGGAGTVDGDKLFPVGEI